MTEQDEQNHATPAETLAEISQRITRQNHALIARLNAPDFDPAVELDNTRNNAGYILTDFFETLKHFPHGSVPTEVTDEAVHTTDELLNAIVARYGDRGTIRLCVAKCGHAFRNTKHIWRIRTATPRLAPAVYAKKLDEEREKIFAELNDLNLELDHVSHPQPQPTPPPIFVTKDEVQAIVSKDGEHTRKAISRSETKLKSTIRVATQGADKGCHHPKKDRDKLVQEVIKYLARPGVTFSINNACIYVAGKNNSGKCKHPWLYDWCHSHSTEIHAQVDLFRALK